MNVPADKSYLHIGSAPDCATPKERLIYRLFEILPGFLVWGTFIGMMIASLLAPVGAAIFIIVFDFYWLLKSIYFSWHLRQSFRLMRRISAQNWTQKLDQLDLSHHALGIRDWRADLWHLVILPYYKESYEIIRNTCNGILATQYPADRILIALSGETRAGEETRIIGERIAQEVSPRFGKFLFTMHEDQPGELAGKGANETWAARRAAGELIDAANIPQERVIVSVFDVDTVPSPQYFARLAYCYLTAKKPLRTSFQPIPFFINNIWEAPALARIIAFSSTIWHMMNQMRPERLVSFSSHAFPLRALVEMDFWQTNVVSEDSRIFWQGLLTFDGDWRVEPLSVPVSMDANVAETFWKTMRNLYLQQRRWAYGSADIPYFLYGFLRDKKIAFKTKFYWAFHLIESFWAWATNSIMIFLMGWLTVIIGGKIFETSVLAYNTPRLTGGILTIGMFGIITSIYISLVLLPPRPGVYGKSKYISMVAQWFLIPITLIFFGSLPAIDAETRLMFGRYLGFWSTPKIRKGIQQQVFETKKDVF